MTSFNEGIEVAEVSREQAIAFLQTAARNWSHISLDEDGLEDFRIELERFRQKVLAVHERAGGSMTHTAGFNAGIEAAWRLVVQRSQNGFVDALAVAEAIESLKRPEPSEGERVEKVAAAIERELMTDEMLLADPATLRKIKSQRIARAALKAMEVE